MPKGETAFDWLMDESNSSNLSTVTSLDDHEPEGESMVKSSVRKQTSLCSRHILGHIYNKKQHQFRRRLDQKRSFCRYPGARDSKGRLIEKEGILFKRGRNWPQLWMERHIILRADVLEYYSLSAQSKPRGTLKLDSTSICIETQPKNCFSLMCNDVTWIFQCPSKQNCCSWVRAINGAIQQVVFQVVDAPISTEEPVLLARTYLSSSSSSSPPVTPPMEINYCDLNLSGRPRLPPSPSVARKPNGTGVIIPTWPQPNYKFATTG